MRNRVVQRKGTEGGSTAEEGQRAEKHSHKCSNYSVGKSEATLLVPQTACHQHHQESSKRTDSRGLRLTRIFLLPGMDIFLDSG